MNLDTLERLADLLGEWIDDHPGDSTTAHARAVRAHVTHELDHRNAECGVCGTHRDDHTDQLHRYRPR